MPRFIVSIVALLTAVAAMAESSGRHELTIELDWNFTDTKSTLGAWPDGGFGKLRYDSGGSAEAWSRIVLDYQGQIAPQLFGHVVFDYIEDAWQEAGLTEAYLEWRPLPEGANRHRFRFGTFYPAFSLENSGLAWESPYSRSFSAVNAWLGEEVRPTGAEWRLQRPLGDGASPHEFGANAGVFYGNDTAATLLFWRGWSVHDRQTRLNERLPLPPMVFPGTGGGPDIVMERKLDPIAEIDDRPGFYLGTDWRYARRAKLALGFWDNRGDPNRFRDGQWSWGTRFWHLAAQISLPGDIGLIAQRLRGDTDWLINVTSLGTTTPLTELATDEFAASFLLLSKTIGDDHRVSLRRDNFDIWRPGQINVDRGTAATVAYAYRVNPSLELQLEWMEIESSRDLWPLFYGQLNSSHTESLVQLGVRWIVFRTAD